MMAFLCLLSTSHLRPVYTKQTLGEDLIGCGASANGAASVFHVHVGQVSDAHNPAIASCRFAGEHPGRPRSPRRWSMAWETVGHPCFDHDDKYAMRGIGGGGADWEQREYPNRLVRRRFAPNRHQRLPLSCDASCLGRSPVLTDGHRHPPFRKFSSAIHDVRYRLSWGLLIEAIETGERAADPLTGGSRLGASL